MDKEAVYFRKRLIRDMKKWTDDFEKSQPHNVQIDYDSFEGSAYSLIVSAYVALQNSIIKE
jgi:hypothetical protein